LTIRRHLSVGEIDSNPHAEWNAFIDLLAVEDYEDLDTQQRQAHLIFWYESEVQNGGHFQYFENRGTQLVPETIDALVAFCAEEHANVLRQAHSLASKHHWGEISSVEEFVEDALESEFGDLDMAFHACNPTVLEVLARHLKANRELYLEISNRPTRRS
jgi:hypothetical protein